jgi:Holliday junction resolvase-like endonuclease
VTATAMRLFPHRVHLSYMLPIINPAPLLWLLLIVTATLLAGTVIFFLGILKGKELEAKLQRRSQKLSRSILGGVFSEQVAPFLPDFPKDLKPSEARFIGKPIDFLIFKGMDEEHIDDVVFVEIKSGRSQLSQNERSLRDAINNKRVRWHEHHIDQAISALPALATSKANTIDAAAPER